MTTEKEVFSQVVNDWYNYETTITIIKDENDYFIEFNQSGEYEILDTEKAAHYLGSGIELTCFDNDEFELCKIDAYESKELLKEFITDIPNDWFRNYNIYYGLTYNTWYKMRKDLHSNELYIYDTTEFIEYLYNIDDLELRKEIEEEADNMQPWEYCLSSAYYDFFIWLC